MCLVGMVRALEERTGWLRPLLFPSCNRSVGIRSSRLPAIGLCVLVPWALMTMTMNNPTQGEHNCPH